MYISVFLAVNRPGKQLWKVHFSSITLLEAPTQRLIWFGKNDVRTRPIQEGRIGSRGKGIERGMCSNDIEANI